MTIEEFAAKHHTTPDEIRRLITVGHCTKFLPAVHVGEAQYDIAEDAMTTLKRELGVSVIRLKPAGRFDTRRDMPRLVLGQKVFTKEGQADTPIEE